MKNELSTMVRNVMKMNISMPLDTPIELIENWDSLTLFEILIKAEKITKMRIPLSKLKTIPTPQSFIDLFDDHE